MKTQKTDKHYVSAIDKRLAEFDRSHMPSPSQKAEIEKYRQVDERRDRPTMTKKKESIWDF